MRERHYRRGVTAWIQLVIGDDIVTTDEAILEALQRAHDGEEPIDLLDELRARSAEADDPE